MSLLGTVLRKMMKNEAFFINELDVKCFGDSRGVRESMQNLRPICIRISTIKKHASFSHRWIEIGQTTIRESQLCINLSKAVALMDK